MDLIIAHVRLALRFVQSYKAYGALLQLRNALASLRMAFCECNRLGRHDIRARVCRMRNWVAAELARVA